MGKHFQQWLRKLCDATRNRNGVEVNRLLQLTRPWEGDSEIVKIDPKIVERAVAVELSAVLPPGETTIFVEIVNRILILRRALVEQTGRWADAFRQGNKILDILLEYYLDQEIPIHDWLVPILAGLCSVLHRIAQIADQAAVDESDPEDEMDGDDDHAHRRYTKELLNQIRRKLGRVRGDEDKHAAYIVLLAQSIKGCMVLGNAQMATGFLKAIESRKLNVQKAPRGPMVNFRYYLGKLLLQQEQIQKAQQELSWALVQCPPDVFTMRRNIMEYLCTARFRLGILPREELLRKYHLDHYIGIRKSIILGNIKLFDDTVSAYDFMLIYHGTILCIEKLRFLVFRTLLRRAKLWWNEQKLGIKPSIIPIALFSAACKWQIDDEFDDQEAACILGNLIKFGLVKGYISWEHMVVVLSNVEPFPSMPREF